MGQSVDFPDPLETPAPASGAGADDLLSQLAGDEIDRLLAEAEVEKGAAAPLADDAQPLPDASEVPAIAQAASEPIATASGEPSAQQEPTRATGGPSVPLGDAVAAALKVEAPSSNAAPTDPEPDAAHLAAAEAAMSAGAAALPAEINSREEYDALLHEDASDLADAPLPLWLRPLEWLNAPMQTLPEPTRQFLGKAAILTLVNSAAVIAYVLMVRKH